MGYSHGTKWNEEKIIDAIEEIVKSNNMTTMPTHTEMEKYYGNKALCNAIAKRKGSKYYADLLGLKIKPCESKFGEQFEYYCINQIEEKFDCKCTKTPIKFAYDVLVDNAVKIDVKVGKIYHSETISPFYTFNLEKQCQSCDIFVCYCINDNKQIEKTLVIPSYVMSGKTQLTVGIKNSRYDKYVDAWNIIEDYKKFIQNEVL